MSIRSKILVVIVSSIVLTVGVLSGVMLYDLNGLKNDVGGIIEKSYMQEIKTEIKSYVDMAENTIKGIPFYTSFQLFPFSYFHTSHHFKPQIS